MKAQKRSANKSVTKEGSASKSTEKKLVSFK